VETQNHLTEASLPAFLCEIGLLEAGERVSVEAAGDGNINWVRRVRSLRPGSRSWIVKQARPALERFPEYSAPTERILFEQRYYERVAPLDADGVCPRVLGFAREARTLVLEDLGLAPRLDTLLAGERDVAAPVSTLAAFLGRVHRETRGRVDPADFPNQEMGALHGDHIFLLPLRPNEFGLEGQIAARAERWQQDAELIALADEAYRRYRETAEVLVHADVQPGNVLVTSSGPKLLDAEIAHVGDPAFDLGTLLAHLVLPSLAAGRAPAAIPLARAALAAYLEEARVPDAEILPQAARYAALEAMRRTLGAARIPATAEEGSALRVLDWAERWLRKPPASASELGHGL